jgi:predicted DNA binding CopG/RHH family protein
MEPKAMKRTLDKNEREIERSADLYHPVEKKELRRIQRILNHVRKARNINIRISETVLAELKRRSLEEGIPYQTLISSVLHKFVTNRLVDEKAIRRSIQFLSERRRKAAV